MAVQDPPMPAEIEGYHDQMHWGEHHHRWHIERMWYRLSAADRRRYAVMGYRRAERQEGDPGNGLEFLAMHRVMKDILLEKFPDHRGLFAGWTTPPTDPFDKDDEVPALQNGSKPPFPTEYFTAIERIERQPQTFEDDDAFGLYIQTPRNQDAVGAGIHNGLHSRWQGITQERDLGQPFVNMKNARFWRLHGWIDAQWTAFRKAKGLPDDQPEYVEALKAARDMMEPHGHQHLFSAELKVFDVPVQSSLELTPTFSRILFEGGGPPAGGLSSSAIIDFDFAEVVTEPATGERFVVVSGYKPYANMSISLEPRIYIRTPEYWAIEVVGTLPEIGLPQVAPYVEAIPLHGITGTKGIEIIGIHDSLKIDVSA